MTHPVIIQLAKKRLTSPYQEGWSAYFKGREMGQNPFKVNSEEWSDWARGWIDAKNSSPPDGGGTAMRLAA